MAPARLIYDDAAPEHLRRAPAVETLRRVWVQQYECERDDEGGGHLRWRKSGNLPPAALMVSSPDDLDARHSSKRGGHWRGYKVHLTESCDDDGLLAILNVETTVATDQDWAAVEPVHQRLNEKDLLPAEHFVDSAYVSADLLANSQSDFGVDLVGPFRPNRSWQMDDDEAYDVSHFALDWEREVATCPQGHESRSAKGFAVEAGEAGQGPWDDPDGPGPLRQNGLRRVLGPTALYMEARRAARAHAPRRPRPRAGRATTKRWWLRARARRPILGAVPGLSGRRGSRLAGRADGWTPAVALPRAGEDAPPARGDGGGDESEAGCRLARWSSPLAVLPVAVFSADGGLREFANNIDLPGTLAAVFKQVG